MTSTILKQVQSLIIRPGARPNQILLGLDLTEVENVSQVLNALVERGYEPEIRYLQLAIGLHVFAVLREATYSDELYEQLLDEWEILCEAITPDDLNKAVRLWSCRPAMAIVAAWIDAHTSSLARPVKAR